MQATTCLTRALQADYNITALGIASKNGHAEAVRVLVAAGADVNAMDKVRGTVMYPPRKRELGPQRKDQREQRRGTHTMSVEEGLHTRCTAEDAAGVLQTRCQNEPVTNSRDCTHCREAVYGGNYTLPHTLRLRIVCSIRCAYFAIETSAPPAPLMGLPSVPWGPHACALPACVPLRLPSCAPSIHSPLIRPLISSHLYRMARPPFTLRPGTATRLS